MNVRHFTQALFAKGRNLGYEDMEIYISTSSSFNVGIFKSDIDSYSLEESQGLSFRGLISGKMGYAFTEKIDESSIDMLLNDAKENAELIDSEDKEVIFAGSQSYGSVEAYYPQIDAIEAATKIDTAKALDAKCYALSEQVVNVRSGFTTMDTQVTIINTKGLDLHFRRNGLGAMLYVVASDGKEQKTASKVRVGRSLSDIDTDKMAQEPVDEVLSLFGGQPVPSKDYPVILRYDVATGLLSTFSGSFSAENVQKGLSMLKDQLGEQLASTKVNIIDDPLDPKLPQARPFDDEGVATRTKSVVEKGVLKTYLHNLKTAHKDGVESTGNARKRSYKGSVGIAPTNMFIQEGDKSFDELIASMGEGIIIINVQGLHSGANAVSGDFSLGAYGYYVQNGRITHPVSQITIAGNFFELLQDIEEIANDTNWGHISIASPSLKVKKLSIAGI